MKQIIHATLAGVLAALTALPAQSEPTKKTSVRLEPKALLRLTLNTLRLPRPEPLGLPPPKDALPCSADGSKDDCSSKIALYLGSVTYTDNDGKPLNKLICVAVGYDVEVKTGTGAPKRINYSLDVKDTNIKSPEFRGAEILKDNGKEHDGTDVNPKRDKLTIKTKRKGAGKAIYFLPQITWDNNGQLDLCAAVDPKIVNVP
jgi:hypothetical protein